MYRFAQCTVVWKKFQNLLIHIPGNHDDDIGELSLIQVSWIISTIRRNYSESHFLHKQNVYLNYYQFHWKLSVHNLQNQPTEIIYNFVSICVNGLWWISDTGTIMTLQRRCHARDSQIHA